MKCSDGHISDSRAEYLVDEWLFSHNIIHEIHPSLPWSKFKEADFLVGDTYIELWGMEQFPGYEDKKRVKLEEYALYHFKVLSLKPRPIYKGNFSELECLLTGE